LYGARTNGLFSEAPEDAVTVTASRTFHARRARKSQMNSGHAAGSSNGMGTPAESEDKADAVEVELDTTHPWQSGGS
jgi:hypothetical protein